MKFGRLLVTGGLIFLIYNLGNLKGRITAHEEFVNKYGKHVFEKESAITTSLFKNAVVYSCKKENE